MPHRFLALLGLALFTGCRAYVPEKVTTEGLLAITRGMTYEQVEALIGPPLCIVHIKYQDRPETDERRATDLMRCGPFARTTRAVPDTVRRVAELSLSYAEPRAAPFTDPDIYVNFKAGRVTEVYIKKDDYGICCMDGLPTSPFYWIGSRELLHELIGR